MHKVECQVCEWTDHVNVEDELWCRHTVLQAFSLSGNVGTCCAWEGRETSILIRVSGPRYN